MQIETKYFGMVEIDENAIIDFPEGLPGFEDEKRFVLLGKQPEQNPFVWLQCVDCPQLAFVMIDPRTLIEDYTVDVDDSEVEILDIVDTNNVLIYSIVVVPEDISKMTANLKAPVLINSVAKKGKQVILDNEEYRIRHYIMDKERTRC
ncbi:MAG TPA: flagellar assembly protein FliW [Clostridiaceae bacterium]|jgi:flagellar assembly factor FliW|nr:flagellar assembly protein FliW [Clostridiaceae bacterium]